MLLDKKHDLKTVNQILLIAHLVDGFWDRWKAHGVEDHDLHYFKQDLPTLGNWLRAWDVLAKEKENKALMLKNKNSLEEAEYYYRQAALYYQLGYWILPIHYDEKKQWLKQSLALTKTADDISFIPTEIKMITVDGKKCIGRVRKPHDPKGCIIMVNPIDSSKEELFQYEMDFLKGGYVVMNFDGPGQGETLVFEGLKASKSRWEQYVNQLINYALKTFPTLPIHLFGTSSGGAWALYGSCMKEVSKVVAVSPAVYDENLTLPEYFLDRINDISDNQILFLPEYNQLDLKKPVFLFHGKKDVMVSDESIHTLFSKLPSGKQLVEYREEGHCCNFKLNEIRKLSMTWFQTEAVL